MEGGIKTTTSIICTERRKLMICRAIHKMLRWLLLVGEQNSYPIIMRQKASIIDKSRQSTPSEKLPKIQRGQNAEILYRADEYFDEFSKKPNTTKSNIIWNILIIIKYH